MHFLCSADIPTHIFYIVIFYRYRYVKNLNKFISKIQKNGYNFKLKRVIKFDIKNLKSSSNTFHLATNNNPDSKKRKKNIFRLNNSFLI